MPSHTPVSGSEPRTVVSKPGFRPDIEGLRAIAVLLVVGFHAKVPGLTGGFVGVDVFFVLSGYLITWLLLYEIQETGRVDLGRFYARRARRLLPALGLVLTVTILASWLVHAPVEQRNLAGSAFASAGYFSNLYFARSATDYLGDPPDQNPFLHTWSLSVEEQFYLLWPLLLVSICLGAAPASGRHRLRLLRAMLVVSVVAWFGSYYLTSVRPSWGFFFSVTRAWEFGAGALALLMPGLLRASPRVSLAMAAAGLAAILGSATAFGSGTLFPGLAALVPVAGTAMVLYAGGVHPEGTLTRWLSSPVLQPLGRLSYSWYLWHWPAIVFLRAVRPDSELPARLAVMAGALLLAEISYRTVEDPIRHHPALLARRRRTFLLAGMLTVGVLGLSVGWKEASEAAAATPGQIRFTAARADIPSLYGSGCLLRYEAVEIQVDGCVAGDAAGDTTLILLGDSHAAQWFPPLEQIAVARHWRLLPLTKSKCAPYGDDEIPEFRAIFGRAYTECVAWRSRALALVAAERPAIVVVSSIVRDNRWSPRWAAGFEETLEALSASSGTVVVIRDTPAIGFDVPICLARRAKRVGVPSLASCRYPREESFRASEEWKAVQLEAARRLANVSVLDLSEWICSTDVCDTVQGDMVQFRDTNHLSATFAATLAGPIERHLDELSARTR